MPKKVICQSNIEISSNTDRFTYDCIGHIFAILVSDT